MYSFWVLLATMLHSRGKICLCALAPSGNRGLGLGPLLGRFHCSVTGDVLMLEHAGDTVLNAMGIVPAAKGIIEPAAMPAAIEAIEMAIARDESTQDRTEAPPAGTDSPAEEFDAVSLRQRAWPLIDMMRRAHAEGAAIVWGV